MAKNSEPTFADFWAAYPVHKDRKRAEQAWQRLTATDRRAAIAALPGYIADCQRNGIDKYKYAQGWLNDRRWEDDLSDGITNTAERNAATPHSGIELW